MFYQTTSLSDCNKLSIANSLGSSNEWPNSYSFWAQLTCEAE